MTMLRLPSLANLLAFVTVGKHKSFKHAADELLLTPGAVSQKIKNLEDQLGSRLFIRSSQKVSFTAKGASYYNEIYPVISKISEISQRTFGQKSKTTLTISVLPSFALRWLIPRLDSFHRQNPDLTININATERIIDFELDGVDLAIRHGLGSYPKLCADRLFSEDLIPICSPKLGSTERPLNSLSDLAFHTLLHDSVAKDWDLMLRALEIKAIDLHAGPRFDSDTLMIQSAIEGHGVALARSSLVKVEIARGTLIVPFDIKIPSEFAYYIVYPEAKHHPPEVRLFRDWLILEGSLYSKTE